MKGAFQMRSMLAVIIGVIGGFVIGIAMSSFIGVLGMLVIGQPVGIKFLPYFTAIICAIVVPILDSKSRKSAVG